MGGVTRYIDSGIQPGDFLTAIICNDLKVAVDRADTENMGNLPAYVAYFTNHAPMNCWGSKANMTSWIKTKRAEAEFKQENENEQR